MASVGSCGSDARRVGVGRHREVRAGQARRRPHGGQQVLDDGEVEHLLLADRQQGLPPALHRRELLRRQALVHLLLERVRRELVLEHDQVLQLGRLAERVDQRLPVLQPVAGGLPAADLDDAGEWAARARQGVLAHVVRTSGSG
jgi:hypothetical protein